MAASITDRALARAAGRAQRLAPEVAALVQDVEGLRIDVRRQAVAVMEDLDLLRHCLRLATLEQAIDGPRVGKEKGNADSNNSEKPGQRKGRA